MKPEVRRELVNSVRLARTLNHTGIIRRRIAYQVLSLKEQWLEKSAQSFDEARWWLAHGRDLKRRYGP
jgi:hypothetical protein